MLFIRRSSGIMAMLVFLAFALVLMSSPATALPPLNLDKNGVAIKGYDPVAYFTEGKPVKGEEMYSYSWNGGIWRFASAQHLAMFKADPEKYAPQYGGY